MVLFIHENKQAVSMELNITEEDLIHDDKAPTVSILK